MIVGVYGYSSSGKTTFMEKLIKRLVDGGYTVAAIKHAPHDDVTIDSEGTDTYRHAQAGASIVIAAGNNETDIMIKRGKSLNELKHIIEWTGGADVILAEGYKDATVKKIRVGDIDERENTIATYKNENDFETIFAAIKRAIDIEKIYDELPKLNCGKCGSTCEELAEEIYKGKKSLSTCAEFSKRQISIEFNNKPVAAGKFVGDIVSNTILGLVSSLKGYEGKKTKTITVTITKLDEEE